MASSSTSVLQKLAFTAITVVGLLLLAELGLRAVGVGAGAHYELKPGLLWAQEPNVSGREIRTRDGQLFTMSTNADGLRHGPEARGADPSGRPTVLWLGDSIVFGWGVPDEHTPPVALEASLAELRPDAPVRVINGACPGYSSYQSLALLSQIGVHYAPDVVVLEIPGHNKARAAKTDRASLADTTEDRAHMLLLEWSRIYRVVRATVLRGGDAVTGTQQSHLVAEYGMGEPITPRVTNEDMVLVLDDITSLGRKHGFEVVVTFAPSLPDLPGEYAGLLQPYVDASALKVVDYGADVRAAGLDNATWWVDQDAHWNQLGARLATKHLAKHLEARQVLPRTR